MAQVRTAAAQESSLPEIVVTGEQAGVSDGSVAAGYRTGRASTTGPWRDLKLQDTPYSINVIPEELIKNVQATTPDQLLRMNPVVQLIQPTASNARPSYNIRGFNNSSNYEDGLRVVNGWGIAPELYERVEVLSGLSGFLYGPANVGGIVNYVSKQPLAQPHASITGGTLGARDGLSYYTHGDFGGSLDKEGRVRVRMNVASQDGTIGPDEAKQRRNLINGALDWHVTDRFVVGLTATHFDYRQIGLPATWLTANTGVSYPAAPNVNKLWSQPWTYQELTTNKVGAHAKWEINDVFTFRSAFTHSTFDDQNIAISNTLNANGTYSQSAQARAPRTLYNDAGYAYLDAKFNTGPLQHTLTMGYNADRYYYRSALDMQQTLAVGTFPFGSEPGRAAQPNFNVGQKPRYTNQTGENRNIVVGDKIDLGQYVTALVGVTRSNVAMSVMSAPGVTSSSYDRAAYTPTGSLIFKATPWLSLYGTYIQSLEQGLTVPLIGYTNAGEVLPPVISEQYEVGAKATLGGMLITTSYFQIDKANYYSFNNGDGTLTYRQDGRQVHKGVEIVAGGNLATGLRLFGGLTFFNAEVLQTANPALIGKRPQNVSETMAKAYLEYDLPFIPGLTLTGGVYYTGSFFADATNLQALPSYTLADLGARYTTEFQGRALILRANVTNIADKSYWQSGNFLGDPRRYTVSAQLKF
jgi:iron complex outermembrane receptor protein